MNRTTNKMYAQHRHFATGYTRGAEHHDNSRQIARRRGFTLIEIAVCLVILALLAAVAVVSLHSLRYAAQLEDVVNRIGQLDRHTRDYAALYGRPSQLIIDLDKNRFTANRAAGQTTPGLRLPGAYELTDLWLPGRKITDGQLAVPYSAQGRTETFALRIAGPGDTYTWLIVAGMTGQVTLQENQDVVEKIMDNLAPTRDDAA
jgi:type II secretion system protein H